MLAGQKAVTEYNKAVNAYVACIDQEDDAAIAKGGDKIKPEQKADMERVEVQKHNAAIDQLQSVADRFNEQVKVYKAKSDETPRSAAVLTPAEADELIGQHLQCLPIESLPLAQCAGGGAAREHLRRARPAAVRPGGHGRHRARQPRRGRGPARLPHAGDAGRGRSAADARREHCLHRGHDRRGAAGRVRQRRAGRRARGERGGEAELRRRRCRRRRGRTCTGAAATRARAPCCWRRAPGCTPPEIAIAASAGMARIRVSSQPMLAVISTGNELIEPGEPMLAAPGPPLQRLRHRRARCASTASSASRTITSMDDAERAARAAASSTSRPTTCSCSRGGVSMGRFDLVPQGAGRARRARDLPSSRAAAGQADVVRRRDLGRGRVRAARQSRLDAGVPAAAMCCRRCLPAWASRPPPPERMALGAPVTVTAPLTCFMPVRVEQDDWGRPWAMPARPTARATSPPSPAPTASWSCRPGPNTYPKGFVTRLYRWS